MTTAKHAQRLLFEPDREAKRQQLLERVFNPNKLADQPARYFTEAELGRATEIARSTSVN